MLILDCIPESGSRTGNCREKVPQRARNPHQQNDKRGSGGVSERVVGVVHELPEVPPLAGRNCPLDLAGEPTRLPVPELWDRKRRCGCDARSKTFITLGH